MKWTVDRIENHIAVCESQNGGFLDIKLDALPNGVKEGDVLDICVDRDKTEKRKEKMNGLMNSLFNT